MRDLTKQQWFLAVQNNDTLTVRRLMHKFAGHRNVQGLTALHIAASSNKIELVRLLVGREARMTNPNGWTALMLAAQCGYVDIVEVLLPVESRNVVGSVSALSLAAQNGHLETTKILIKYEPQEIISAFCAARANKQFECANTLQSAMRRAEGGAEEEAMTTQKDEDELFDMLEQCAPQLDAGNDEPAVDLDKYTRKIEDQEDQIERLGEQLAESSKMLQQSVQLLQEEQQASAALRKTIDDEKMRLRAQQSQQKQSQILQNNLKMENQQLRDEIQKNKFKLDEQIVATQKIGAQARLQNDRWTESYLKQQAEVQDLRQQIQQLQIYKTEKVEQIRELEILTDQYIQESYKNKKEAENTMKYVQDLQQQLEQKQIKFEQLQDMNQQMAEQLAKQVQDTQTMQQRMESVLHDSQMFVLEQPIEEILDMIERRMPNQNLKQVIQKLKVRYLEHK